MARVAVDELVDAHLQHEARGEIDAALAAFADDVIFDVVNAPGGPMIGIDAVRRGYETFASVAQCEAFTPVRRLHGENLVVDEGMWQGRFVGALFGPARPDLTVRYRVLHVLEFRAGRIVRETAWHDLAAIRRQLAGEEPSS
ncbi:MAG: nuclear transport factor 2 family protein [Actinobacteria bacterium]|nr:nuclear transport factor 2 family protein [Actinomycetota bacterium]